MEVASPASPQGLVLEPFFRLLDERYQMYWELTASEKRPPAELVAATERERAALEAATLDAVTVGEQQSKVEYDFEDESTNTGLTDGWHWRDARGYFQYKLNGGNASAADLAITYWGSDHGRSFDILVNQTVIATESLSDLQPGAFVVKRYPIPASAFPVSGLGICRFGSPPSRVLSPEVFSMSGCSGGRSFC